MLYVKLLLKPLELLDQKMAGQSAAINQSLSTSLSAAQDKGQSSGDRMQQISGGGAQTSESAIGEVSFLSDEEDNGAEEKKTGNQPISAGGSAGNADGTVDLNEVDSALGHTYRKQVDACLSTLIETLLSLQPDHLA